MTTSRLTLALAVLAAVLLGCSDGDDGSDLPPASEQTPAEQTPAEAALGAAMLPPVESASLTAAEDLDSPATATSADLPADLFPPTG